VARKELLEPKDSSGRAIYFDNLEREKTRLALEVLHLQQENTRLAGQVVSLRKLEVLSKLTGILNIRELRNENLLRVVQEILDSSLALLSQSGKDSKSET